MLSQEKRQKRIELAKYAVTMLEEADKSVVERTNKVLQGKEELDLCVILWVILMNWLIDEEKLLELETKYLQMTKTAQVA